MRSRLCRSPLGRLVCARIVYFTYTCAFVSVHIFFLSTTREEKTRDLGGMRIRSSAGPRQPFPAPLHILSPLALGSSTSGSNVECKGQRRSGLHSLEVRYQVNVEMSEIEMSEIVYYVIYGLNDHLVIR